MTKIFKAGCGVKYNRETRMSSIFNSQSRKLFESMSFSALQSHVSSLLGKMWCIEATGTKLGEIGNGWKCLLARARCGFQRAYSCPDIMLEWFDISHRLVKMNDVSFVKLNVEWKCFSFSLFSSSHSIFWMKLWILIVYTIFFLPRIKSRPKINIYFTHFKLASFICLGCYLYEWKVYWFYSENIL